jgi:hypothetical protein
MRKIYTILFTLIVLLSMAMSAEALGSKTFERHNGGSAYADWTEVNGDITTHTYLSVTETDAGTDVYLDIYTWGPDYWSEESGYMFTKDDVFSIDKKLNSASLSQVDITVNDWNTGEQKTLAVKADWTGKGDVSTGSYTSKSKSGNYVMRTSDSSSSREASVKGIIDNFDIVGDSYASMSKFKSAYMSMEK